MFGEHPGEPLVSPAIALDHAFEYVREHRELHRLFTVRDAGLAEIAYARTRDEIVSALEIVLSRSVERGLLRPMNPRVVAELLFSLVGGALDACFLGAGEASEDEYRREVVRCVERVVAPDSTDPNIRRN